MAALWRRDSEYPGFHHFVWYLQGLCQAFEKAFKQRSLNEPLWKTPS